MICIIVNTHPTVLCTATCSCDKRSTGAARAQCLNEYRQAGGDPTPDESRLFFVCLALMDVPWRLVTTQGATEWAAKTSNCESLYTNDWWYYHIYHPLRVFFKRLQSLKTASLCSLLLDIVGWVSHYMIACSPPWFAGYIWVEWLPPLAFERLKLGINHMARFQGHGLTSHSHSNLRLILKLNLAIPYCGT